MLKSIRVADYMAQRLVALSPEMSVEQAIALLLEHRISGAPVVENGRLAGVFSEQDCFKDLLEAGYHNSFGGLVRDHMSTSVDTIRADDSIIAAAEKFLRNKRRRLPVLDAAGKLVGQISRRDVLRAIADIRNGSGGA